MRNIILGAAITLATCNVANAQPSNCEYKLDTDSVNSYDKHIHCTFPKGTPAQYMRDYLNKVNQDESYKAMHNDPYFCQPHYSTPTCQPPIYDVTPNGDGNVRCYTTPGRFLKICT
jgi:hypothetical protein